MNTQTHTPTPLKVAPDRCLSTHDLPYATFACSVYSPNGDYIAKVYGRTIEEAETNAAALVNRYNNHGALVEALREMLDKLKAQELMYIEDTGQDVSIYRESEKSLNARNLLAPPLF